MKRFVLLLGLIVAVSLLLWAMTPQGASVAGMPVACTGEPGQPTPCWIKLGGLGVLVLGGGAGLVEIGIGGLGLLFATGQLALGLIAFGQVVLGPVFFCAQGGLGLAGMAQGGLGLLTIRQGAMGGEGRRFLDQLNEELRELLSFF